MLQIYGIPNCNTVKKALTWLDDQHISYTFHNYKKEGVTANQLQDWVKQIGWEPLVNKKGTTWRQLTPDIQTTIKDAKSAIALMQEKTSVIKRPLIEQEGKILTLGFDENTYETLFTKP